MSSCDPGHAAVGDVGAALMVMDSRLKAVYDGKTATDPEQEALIEQITASLGPKGADDVLDGACTLIFMYMKWLRAAYEDQEKDVIEYVVTSLVASMRVMTRSVPPEVIPTMTGLVVAAGTGLSPNLWRKQYGYWTRAEMTPLEVTVVLLAEHINRLTGDRDYATRLITDALAGTDID
ncbi:hypothetical protein [Streptomyces tsukubensis]|uniref:Uncharacterized protein n=1 Tax=Streptomyces tsukubensis TaxID=83656 RepID=A0A1V4A2F9_9ACTN|nr:hypothetical protein [Streptomyces tsukubensis]OON73861.1 hypothetical protein B1H18_26760 [Streptomyces tsukubensis]QFR91767.1 hypothetical protein GBW32_00260 [Streptomyces tsukubensis]